MRTHCITGLVGAVVGVVLVALPFLMVLDGSMWHALHDRAFLQALMSDAYRRDRASFVVIPAAVLGVAVILPLSFRSLALCTRSGFRASPTAT